jgi:hypothetical protein
MVKREREQRRKGERESGNLGALLFSLSPFPPVSLSTLSNAA